MTADLYGAELATEHRTAVLQFGKAGQALLRHGPGFAEALDTALEADPDFSAAHAVAGLAHILQAREGTLALAANHAQRAQVSAEGKRLSGFERGLIEALQRAAQGQWQAGAQRLAAAVDPDRPHPLLIKLTHALHFLVGDHSGMLALTAPYANRDEACADFGFVLGCHAFALEENGDLAQAEALAHKGLHLAPDDIWGMHALAHVYEATNRVGEGLLWVESGRQSWSRCNNFAHHMSWHLALFHIERGSYDRALQIYDCELAAKLSQDFRDSANAISLLLRIEQMGMDTGARFDTLHDLARARRADASYVFASLHYLIALLARKDFAGAEDTVTALRERAQCSGGDQSIVARDIGVPLGEALVRFALDGVQSGDLVELAQAIPVIGGSGAQRDLFLRALVLMADNVCDHRTSAALLALRHRSRREDAFLRMMNERRCFGTLAKAHHVA